MLTLSREAMIVLALVAGAWVAVALWATLRARRRAADAIGVQQANERSSALLEAAPAMALLVHPNERLGGPARLAGALGLTGLPATLSELPADVGDPLRALVEEGALGGSATTTLRPEGSARTLRVDGGPAPPEFGAGAVLLWFTDVSEAEHEAAALRARLERRSAALEALSRLIEVAPFPMWHRGPDQALTMVNSAYVHAVEAADAAEVDGQLPGVYPGVVTGAPRSISSSTNGRSLAAISGDRFR